MNKVAVCGKGGSGKSTVVSLLAHGLSRRGYEVLVVDSDESNLGLHRILGIDSTPVTLMDSIGGKGAIKRRLPPKTAQSLSMTQTGILEAEKIRPADIPAPYIGRKNGISMVSIGKIHEALEGCACPIGALGKEFLEKLHIDTNEIVLVDMEAGVEHFGRGVEAGVDGILIVVDPSFESVELAQRINTISKEMGISNVQAVLNRVTSEDMAAKLVRTLSEKKVPVIGTIRMDDEVFTAGLEGRTATGSTAISDVNVILDKLVNSDKN